MKTAIVNASNLDKKAVITSTESYTYDQFQQLIAKYASLFANKGYSKVAIFSENRIEWLVAFYAALQNNCIAVPIDYLASSADVAFIIDDCKPELLFASNLMTEAVEKVTNSTSFKPNVIYFGSENFDTTAQYELWDGIENSATTAVIIYTSGTTGTPKGVMLSYQNIIENMTAVIEAKIFHSESQVLILLPLHHVFPLVGSMMVPFYAGATTVMSPSMQSPDLMSTLANNQVTVFIGVPRLYELIYKGLKAKINKSIVARLLLAIVMASKNRKLGAIIFKKIHKGLGGHLKFMIAGGAALNKDVGNFFWYIGFDILEGFGMTEAAPMISFPRPGKVKIGSTGQALPGLQVEIRNGEIVAKGPSIMKGYFNRPEETADVLKDGWLHTGDLGRFDNEGFLYITGRKKEIIVLSNGKNINPVEIEMKLESNFEAIKEVGVFMHKELLHAVIVPNYKYLTEKEIKDVTAYFRDQVITPFNAEMSSYKRLMQFTLINEDLPRTRLSKLQRFKLTDLIGTSEKKKNAKNEPDTVEYRSIKSFIEKQADRHIFPDDHLEYDIALDSLNRLSLINFIENTFGVKLDEEQLRKFQSVRTMVDHIRANKLFHRTEELNWSSNLKEKNIVDLPKSSSMLHPLVSISRAIFNLFFKIEGKGFENIPEGACFFAPNHQSVLDGFIVLSFLDRKTLKNTYTYAKKDHVKSRFRKYLSSHSNVIVMDLKQDLMGSIQKMAEVVKLDKKILIFPEGTRTLTGEIGTFKETYAIISSELTIPVVPIVISGAYNALPSGKHKIKRGTKITVEFLPPVYPEGCSVAELNEKVKQRIVEKL